MSIRYHFIANLHITEAQSILFLGADHKKSLQGGGKNFPVHEFFLRQSWLQEFFSHVEGVLLWMVHCLHKFFFGKISLAGILGGGIVTPPSWDV